MFSKHSAVLAATVLTAFAMSAAKGQTAYQDDFTAGAAGLQWKAFNGACMTAGDGTGSIPACVGLAYYKGQKQNGGYSGKLPDTTGNGALRFTNGNNNGSTDFANGGNQAGSIISNFTFPNTQGLQVTFETLTYMGDSGGSGNDGADGMSFFLMDGSLPPYDTGAFGGSLGYSCSNGNDDPTVRVDGTVRMYDGLAGAYLGLGIDEYGNFLNGVTNTLNETDALYVSGDNTASGGGYKPNRIGLRGAGNVSFGYLSLKYPSLYPSTLTTVKWGSNTRTNGSQSYLSDAAVLNTCRTGFLWDYSNSANPKQTTTPIADYAAIPNAYKVLSGVKIANESATTRNQATPILYNLKITQDGLLSLSYSYNGGAYQPVITKQNIATSNGTPPASFRFGFAGSTGGSTNIHEILCFKAQPSESSDSSGTINVYQNPTVKTGTQLYLAYYFPSSWSGELTATNVLFDTTLNTVVLANTPNWDAKCILTGVNATTGPCATGATSMTAEAPASRAMLTWNGSKGIPFEWANLTAAQQAALTAGDASSTANRLNYLRGDRSNEINASGAGLYRTRVSVLGDIVDSSPVWSGPPASPYTKVQPWVDLLYPSATVSENSGETYAHYQSTQQGRLNVVFAGSNDGFLHAFRAGSMDVNGNVINSASTPNDGYEVLAYMPASVLQTIHNNSDSTLDFSSSQYAHNWFVNATPVVGDVFYGGVWHTWLVGGLGSGGAAIYALDVSNPGSFSESNAASIVLGEWTSGTLSCANKSGCGAYLGNTYGTPEIRRFHNGQWGAIFGNGYGSSKGTAGIFIMLLDKSTGAPTFYYLPTSSSATSNGIANAASLDIDQDHVIDYIYAGDLLGNIWKFDVTNTDPTQWAVTASSPLFTTPSGQPITTRMTAGALKTVVFTRSVAGITFDTKPERVMISFGTGQQTPQTVTSPTQYTSGTQALYGLWDWDFGDPTTPATGSWNSLSAGQKAISLASPQSVKLANLVQQTITTVAAAGATPAYRTVSKNALCWKGSSGCGASSTMGWYVQLPATNEQIIFDPVLTADGELVVNTFIPATNTPLSCKAAQPTGFSMGLDPMSGGGSPVGYFYVSTNQSADGVQLNGIGIPALISSGQTSDMNSTYFITQTSSGTAAPNKVNHGIIANGTRLNWLQRR